MALVTITCPHCHKEHEINPAAMLGSKTSEAKKAACIANAKKPRPNARKVKAP